MRKFSKTLAALLLTGFGALPLSAQAQSNWPDRPIKLVVGYAAGGPVDTAARNYSKYLGDALGQTVVIENRTGASGIIAAEAVARSAPDGYNIYFMASPTLTITPHIQKAVKLDHDKDFTYIGNILDYTNVMVVNNDLPVKSIPELIAYAKANPNTVSFASAGVGSSNQLSAELLKQRADFDMLHVPYRGNSPAMVDVISGKVSLMFDITGTAINYINSGKVRALAVTSKERNKALPDVPSIAESGVPDYAVTGWYSLAGPANLPEPIVKKLQEAMDKVNSNPDYVKTMEDGGYTLHVTDGKALHDKINAEYKLCGEVIKKAGIQANQ